MRATARPRVAFASSPRFPDLHDDWPLQRAALNEIGIEARTAVWSDPAIDWSSFDLVVANGAWDNIHHASEFLDWVDRVGVDQGVPMVNSPATLRWNLDKRYLRELDAAGVPIVPTRWVEPPGPDFRSLDDGPVALGDDVPVNEIVVKPSISGGGYRTARYEPDDHAAMRAHVLELAAAGRTAMIQPYQPSVDSDGELGLIFLAGEFSHAIHKAPMIRRGVGPTDSLIENQVTRFAPHPSDAQIELGCNAVAVAEGLLGPTTYARVDVVERSDGIPAVLELELLDPVLFFVHHPPAASAFARVIQQRLASV